eukprot:2263318-Prymnesium_polylepis.1
MEMCIPLTWLCVMPLHNRAKALERAIFGFDSSLIRRFALAIGWRPHAKRHSAAAEIAAYIPALLFYTNMNLCGGLTRSVEMLLCSEPRASVLGDTYE